MISRLASAGGWGFSHTGPAAAAATSVPANVKEVVHATTRTTVSETMTAATAQQEMEGPVRSKKPANENHHNKNNSSNNYKSSMTSTTTFTSHNDSNGSLENTMDSAVMILEDVAVDDDDDDNNNNAAEDAEGKPQSAHFTLQEIPETDDEEEVGSEQDNENEEGARGTTDAMERATPPGQGKVAASTEPKPTPQQAIPINPSTPLASSDGLRAAADTLSQNEQPVRGTAFSNLYDYISSIDQSLFSEDQVKEDLLYKWNEEYTIVLLEQSDLSSRNGVRDKRSHVELHMDSAFQLLQVLMELWETLPDVEGGGMMSQHFRQLLFDSLDEYIHPRIANHYDSCHTNVLDSKDIAKIIHWIERYQDAVQQYCPGISMASWWSQERELLEQHYMTVFVRQRMRQQLSSLQQLDDFQNNFIRDNRNGSFLPDNISSLYDEKFEMVQSELAVAVVNSNNKSTGSSGSCCSSHYQRQVLSICNEELVTFLREMLIKVGAQWKDMGVCTFCSIINDAQKLMVQCLERHAKVLMSMRQQQHQQHGQRSSYGGGDDILSSLDHDDFCQSIITSLDELSMHATNYLCERIMYALRSPAPVLSSVGDQDWENNTISNNNSQQQSQQHMSTPSTPNSTRRKTNSAAVDRTVAMLKAFFDYLESCLDLDRVFPKVLKTCFDLTVKTYVESFFSNTLSRGVNNPVNAAQELSQDYLRLVIFFNSTSIEKYHGRGGFYTQSQINRSLYILQNIAVVIDPSIEIETLTNDIRSILVELGNSGDPGDDTGVPPVLHLAGLRKRHQASESMEWLKVITKAKKSIQQEIMHMNLDEKEKRTTAATDGPGYQLPDTRNSKFLQNVRPPLKRGLSREISFASRVHAASVCMLLGGDTGDDNENGPSLSRIKGWVTNVKAEANSRFNTPGSAAQQQSAGEETRSIILDRNHSQRSLNGTSTHSRNHSQRALNGTSTHSRNSLVGSSSHIRTSLGGVEKSRLLNRTQTLRQESSRNLHPSEPVS